MVNSNPLSLYRKVFPSEKSKIFFFLDCNLSSAVPFYEKNEWKPSNTENPGGTLFLPL